MRTKKLLFLLPVLLLMNFRPVVPTELTKAERKMAIDHMKATRDAVVASVKGLSEAQLNFKPTPESWSIAECVEHIALSESNIFGMIQGTLKEPGDPAKKALANKKDEDIFNAITDRSYKVKTSEAFVPSGKFGSTEATLKEFVTKRDQNIEYLKTTKDDLRNHFFTFPVEALGTMDSYQLFYFMAGHTKRHTAQIEEVKSNPAYPK